MKVVRVLVLLVISYCIGMAVAALLFLAVAWATGQLDRGFHSDAALVYGIGLPIAWVAAFVALYRSRLLARA
jgi:hypothetical protein